MSQPPIKPFRCIYDPELSQSKSRGSKPLIQKPRLNEKSSDPRVDQKTNQHPRTGKRSLPCGELPLPPFAAKIPRKSRVFISGLDPTVNILRFYDVLRLYDQNAKFNVAMSKHTGASLGIAWVQFGPESVEASQQFVSDLRNKKITLGSLLLDGQFDPKGALFDDTYQELEDKIRVESEGRELAIRNSELNILELRTLTRDQMTKWFDKYLGNQGTYILIRPNRLALSQSSYDSVKETYRDTKYLRVGGNANGIFVVYETEEGALRALERNFRRKILGQNVDIALTLSGERIKTSEIKDLYRQRMLISLKDRKKTIVPLHEPQTSSREGTLRNFVNVDDSTNRAIQQILDEGKSRIKSLLFNEGIEPLIQSVVSREFSRHIAEANGLQNSNARSLLQAHTSESINYVNGNANTRTLPETLSPKNLVNSGMSVTTSKRPSSSTLPKIRIKKHKSGDNETYNSDTTSSPSGATGGLSPQIYSAKSVIKGLEKVNTGGNYKVSRSVANSVSILNHEAPLPTPEKFSDEIIDVEEDGESEEITANQDIDQSEKLEHKIGSMSLPDFSQLEDSQALFENTETIQDFVGLIKDQDDFLSLRRVLESLEIEPFDESKMIDVYYQRYGGLEPPYTDIEQSPRGQLPYGLVPISGNSDDERRSYGSSIPMDVVVRYNDNMIREESSSQNKMDHYERTTFHLPRSFAKRRSDLFTSNMLTRTAKKTRIARSNIHQWGLYAGEDIPAEEFVIEYVGDILRSDFADIRERSYDAEGIDSTYLFRLNDDVIIDATKRGNSARFMNHSCDPNCYARIIKFNGIERITLYSKRNIKLDEELTFNYNFAKAINECDRVKCTCGAEICAGWLM